MESSKITDYFGIRVGKRKYSTDDEAVASKMAAIEGKGDKPTQNPIERHRRGAVARLCFDGDAAPSKTTSNPSPAPTTSNNKNKVDSMSLEAIKKAVTSSSRLNELKSRISKFDETKERLDRLKSLQKTPDKGLKEFESIDVLVPMSPVKKGSPFTSPVKGFSHLRSPIKSPTKVPAYLRHESLASAAQKLNLPHHYRFLAEVFKAIETAVAMYVNRRETVVFSRVKYSAQELLKRNVTEKHLAQIKHLCPEMYTFTWEKSRSFDGMTKKNEYQLIMTPKIVSRVTGSPVTTMTPEIIVDRQRAFYNLLVEKVKIHHERFLLLLDPPMVIARDKLTRWHPEFDLENIADVDCDQLPKAPDAEQFVTAQDMLAKAKDMFFNPKLQKAFERIAKNRIDAGESVSEGSSEASGSSNTPSMINPALRNIPNALLAKVRARQAEKALKDMTRSSLEEENIIIYQRLPELARVVNNIFVTDKKSVLPVETLLSKLEHSLKLKIPNSKLLDHLKILSAEKGDWFRFDTVRKVEYARITKSVSLSDVISHLETRAEKTAS